MTGAFGFAKRKISIFTYTKMQIWHLNLPPSGKNPNYNISDLTHHLISAWVMTLINILIYCLGKLNLWIQQLKQCRSADEIFSRSLSMTSVGCYDTYFTPASFFFNIIYFLMIILEIKKKMFCDLPTGTAATTPHFHEIYVSLILKIIFYRSPLPCFLKGRIVSEM